ncbi:hypothetical protein Ahy_B04g073508 [Arachis hypogaea]|uniref:Ubiquitin-like protease family profile domain-containing protein n=1 Tax=Arachis hypogaea TaxID=3818 RepID=A0A444ZQL2_ARAHY|nr:hypothetical protein Ahy_B04g073508 [Arachis hypogaea]
MSRFTYFHFSFTAKYNKKMATMKEKAHYNKTHYCRCQTKAIATVYREIGQEKKDIVEGMGFGDLARVPEMNVSTTLLIELIDRFDIERGCLKTKQGTINITPRKVDYNKLNPADKEIFDSVKNISLATLARNVLDMSCFLLPTTVSVASPIHKPPMFHVDNLREWNWAKHVLNFLMKGVENKREGKKQSGDGCIFVLMLIYFHETKFLRPFAPDAPLHHGKLCLNVTRATPESELQIVEFQQQTRSEPLEVPPLALSLPSSVQEVLMKDDFIYVHPQEETQQTSNNDSPQEVEKHGVKVSLTSSVIQDLMKDDYVYEVSNEETRTTSPRTNGATRIRTRSISLQKNKNKKPKNHRCNKNQNKKHPSLEQPCEEPTEQQSKQEAPVDVCPPEPNKQGVTRSITSSVIEQFSKDVDVYQVSDEEQSKEPPVTRQLEKQTLILSSFDSAAQPREREGERPSFSLGISPPASQPTQPSQESDSQLDILTEAVIEAGLKFGEETSSKPTLPAAQVYKTPQKKTKITNKLIDKCYHWMTHVKQTKYSTNEYEPLFVLKHEGLYEGLREYFMSLKPEEQVHAVVVSIRSLILNEIKTKRYQEQIYIMPMDIVNFIMGTYGDKYDDKNTKKVHRHWWLWIADVNNKKFYVLDPINKKPDDIPDSRKEINKFVVKFNNFPDEGVRWGGTLNKGCTGRGSRVYPIKWSTYKYFFCMEKYYHLATVFKNMNQEKKAIVEEIGFGALAYVLEMKVDYRKLNEEDKAIFDSLKCVMLATLTKSILNMSVEGEENRQKFCRTFVVFIQKCFLLRTTVSMASTIHKPPIFCVDNIQQWDWACHVLSFLRKGIENKRKGKKQSVEGCVFVLMLIYFHETKFPHLDGLDAPPAPWVSYWTKKMILDWIFEEATDVMCASKKCRMAVVIHANKRTYNQIVPT